MVKGADLNLDGIPDVLQTATRPAMPTATVGRGMQGTMPTAAVGIDTTGDGRANLVVQGADLNRDGIPDVLQTATRPAMPTATVGRGMQGTMPTATVGIDTTG